MALNFRCTLLSACCLLAACATNPLIGRDQLIVVPDGHLAAMSQESWDSIKSETPVSRDTYAKSRARGVSDRILQAIGETPSAWTIEVFQDETLNAFALPGKQIGITDSMMAFCKNDDELAAVVGHEIAHVKLRHSAERVSQEMLTRGAIGLIAPEDSQTAALLGAGASLGIILPYSRTHELEADKLGVQYLAEAGYRPMAAIELWTRMETVEGRGATTEWLSTHPTDQTRLKALREEIAQLE